MLSTPRAPVQLDQMGWGEGLNLPTSASLSKYTQMIKAHTGLSADLCGVLMGVYSHYHHIWSTQMAKKATGFLTKTCSAFDDLN